MDAAWKEPLCRTHGPEQLICSEDTVTPTETPLTLIFPFGFSLHTSPLFLQTLYVLVK